jgi:hypothetical protein
MPIDLIMAAAPRSLDSYASSPELALVDADLAASLRLTLSDPEHLLRSARRVSAGAVAASHTPEELHAAGPGVVHCGADADLVAALVEQNGGGEVDEPNVDVLDEASFEGGHRGSMPVLPSPQADGLDTAEATEAALKRIRERLEMEAAVAPTKRFRTRFTVASGGGMACALLTLTIDVRLGVAQLPGFGF